MPGFLREHSWPMVFSVLLHAGLAAALLFAALIHLTPSPAALQPLPIDATVIDSQVLHAAQRELAERAAQEAARARAAAEARAAAAAQAAADEQAAEEAKAAAQVQATAKAEAAAKAELAAKAGGSRQRRRQPNNNARPRPLVKRSMSRNSRKRLPNRLRTPNARPPPRRPRTRSVLRRPSAPKRPSGQPTPSKLRTPSARPIRMPRLSVRQNSSASSRTRRELPRWNQAPPWRNILRVCRIAFRMPGSSPRRPARAWTAWLASRR